MKFEAWDTESGNRVARFETRAELLKWLIDLGKDQAPGALRDLMVGEPDMDHSVDAMAWCLAELALEFAQFVARSRSSLEVRDPWQPQGPKRRARTEFRLGTAAKVLQTLPGAELVPAFG